MDDSKVCTQFSKTIQQARDAFVFGKTRSIDFRKKQLKALLQMYEENESKFVDALAKDLRKPRQESVLMELNLLKDDIVHVLSRLDEWVKPEVIAPSIVTLFDKTMIYHDPYGVVLIMGAWNYPLQLPLLPVSGAIAAGNAVIIKPSEVSAATAAVIAELIPKYLDQECYHVICGGIPETTELLKERFDYIFYTGSTYVGKIVRAAANKYLTPTTLELGGKSPVYIDDTVDFDVAVRRILWGKCINAGQTCVAPDYILSTQAVQDKFVAKAKEVIKEWYGENPQQSKDLSRIIHERSFNRLVGYLKDGKVAVGGIFDVKDLYIAPTILVNVSPDSPVMTEEIFGPILPMVTIDSVHDAMKFINNREKALACYCFTTNSSLSDLFMREVSFGGGTINDVIFHIAVPGLPFGGVGESGMGAYHGKATYDCFTHKKSCLKRNYNKIADYIGANRYPPYTDSKVNFLSFMLKERSLPSMKFVKYVAIFGLGALSLYAAQQIGKDGATEWLNERTHTLKDYFYSIKQ